jgi:hypothetical protein
MERIGLVGEARGGDCLVVSLVLQGVAVNDQKDVRTCNFGGKFFSRNDFFLGKL